MNQMSPFRFDLVSDEPLEDHPMPGTRTMRIRCWREDSKGHVLWDGVVDVRVNQDAVFHDRSTLQGLIPDQAECAAALIRLKEYASQMFRR